MIGYTEGATLLAEYQSLANASFTHNDKVNEGALLGVVLSRASYEAAAKRGEDEEQSRLLGVYRDRARSFASLDHILSTPHLVQETPMALLVDAVEVHRSLPAGERTANMNDTIKPLALQVIDAAAEQHLLLSPQQLQSKLDELKEVYEEQIRVGF